MRNSHPSSQSDSNAQALTSELYVRAELRGFPAILGGSPAFPDGLPFMRPTLPPWVELSDPLREIMESGMLTKGRYLDMFEERVAQHLGVKHAVAVSSCTTGLMLVYKILGLSGEVIVPSFTFMATVHALAWQGIEPVFADIDPGTWNMDPASVEALISPRTTAIVGVHVFGNPAPVEALEDIAEQHGLVLILDAAHGFGSLHHGRPLGKYGTAEVFSTSPTKLLVTGEGGVVATNDDELARATRVGREYGNPGTYDSVMPGINARMQEFSAMLGLRSLEMLEENARARNLLAAQYEDILAALPGIGFQVVDRYDRSSYKDFTIQIDAREFGMERDTLKSALTEEGIATRAYYVPPVHQHAAYRELIQRVPPRLPVTEDLATKVLSLPIYSHMAPDAVSGVSAAIRRIQEHAPRIGLI